MIGLDTNVLVRYIVQDDAEQALAATQLIEGRCTERSPGYVSVLVLAELAWVLARAYGYSDSDVSRVMLQLLHTTEFNIEDSDAVWIALRAFEVGMADFPDYLIAHRNRAAGCATTYTFDRRAVRGRHFAAVPVATH